MSSLVGTASLVRLALRRDRVILVVFLVTLVASVAASADATVKLYPTITSRLDAATAVNTATSALALYGPVHDVNSVGALATFKVGMMGAVAVAILGLLLVVRHTRTEEETGRLELLGATVVGRRAPLTAALLVAAGASLVVGAATTLGLLAVGMDSTGSVILGLGYTCLGIAFAAVAGLTAQLTRSARTASGIAGIVLGASYLFRAIGDASSGNGLGWLSWPSPVGWWQQTRPYAGNRWWVLALPVGFAIVVSAVAYALAARRDFAAGLLPERPGPATAAPSLRSPLALAWRLQRGSLLTWLVVFVVLGAVVGGLTSSIDSFLQSAQARDLITKLGGVKGLRDAFLAVELGMTGVAAAVYGVLSASRLRTEETALRAEPLFATSVGRVKWALSHLTIALVGSVLLLVAVGLSAGFVSARQVGDMTELGRVLGGALVQLPAVWLIIGIVVAAFGLAPRAIVVGWVALIGFMLLGEFGSLFNLSHFVMDLSPFAHVPRLPGGAFHAAPLAWLTVIAAGLMAIGLAAFRRRDVG